MAIDATEITVVRVGIEVAVGQCRANGQPSRSYNIVAAKQVESSLAQAKVLDNTIDFIGLLQAAVLELFGNDQVNVHVGMDEIGVRTTANRPFDAHQTVLFGSLKNGFGVQVFVALPLFIVHIGFDPTNVFTSAETPFLQALPS